MKKFNLNKLAWDKMKGLIPVIIQHVKTGAILMLGYMTQETLQTTIETRYVTFYSRSKNRPWQKGETSGHKLIVSEIISDCDQDALLILVEPQGPTCHTGLESCFGDESRSELNFISNLCELIADRNKKRPPGSYVTQLLDSGIKRIAQKVGEEGVEVALAAVDESDEVELCEEMADLIFHMLVLLEARQLSFFDVLKVLKSRECARNNSDSVSY
jgi:phosphoribosyl-AMP cyclohydrolase / phosphoribosyl-ATP pyrophosphohydrolase